jgi:uncharacterized protein DUF4214
MAIFNWTTGTGGDWNTLANWTPNLVPNDAAADVIIDAPTTTLGGYKVTIAAGASEVVNSLTMNATDPNLTGSNSPTYHAAELELDGTLTFAAGSPGLLGGSLQTFIHTAFATNASIVNVGTINGFIQVEGSLFITGTNGFYVTNWLQSLAGTVTVDTKSIAEMTGTTLFDGIYEAKSGVGQTALVNLGGVLQGLAVNIVTVEGPPLIPGGWTELILDGTGAEIQEWNGTKYVTLETTLSNIASRGTVDVRSSRDYTTANTLSVATGGLLSLQAGTVTAAAIDINGGLVKGFATIAAGVVNNGTLMAVGGKLDVVGNLTGTGSVQFDIDQQQLVQLNPVGATLEVHGVSAGQSIVMNGDDTLQLDTPAAFAGTIAAKVGDKIVLQGVAATSAVDTNGTLVVSNGSLTVASLLLAGTFTNDHFSVAGSTILVAAGTTPTQAPPGTVGLHGSHDQYIVADNNGSLYVQDTVAGRDGTQTLPGVNVMTFTDGTGVFDPTGTAGDVDRLYSAALGRAPDVGGLAFWTNDVDGSQVPLGDVAGSFASSPEFIQHFGSLADPAFVQQLYQNVLNRPGDASGAQFWQDQLASGISRGQVVLGFAESPENETDTLATAGDKNNAEAFRLYQATLNRAPDQAGQTFWSSALGNGATPEQLAQGFIGSAEFQQKFGSLSAADFVSQLYQNVLHRAGDPAGQQFWTTQLQQGASQASVVVGFSDGLENRAQTAGATHDDWVFIHA